jgi:hypothetical protein
MRRKEQDMKKGKRSVGGEKRDIFEGTSPKPYYSAPPGSL